jgi:CRISPR-associated protein Cas1
MIKRTLFFRNPCYLSLEQSQLKIKLAKSSEIKSVPIEDLGFIILENAQITITNGVLAAMGAAGVVIVTCDHKHMPINLTLPMVGHTEFGERLRSQLKASKPLTKNLWQQTIKAKIINQASMLHLKGKPVINMLHWAKEVNSGDSSNHEARAAAYYWKTLFNKNGFIRGRQELPPNNLLNYGYAILRAVCARSLVGSGLSPSVGIFHHNKYNGFPLADDIMEPYRPFVDQVVSYIADNHDDIEELTPELKQELLKIPAIDVEIEGKTSPLMVAMSRTTNSLYECFSGQNRKILYPQFKEGNI